ncbi:MAG: AAA-like domain-containing protein [Oscillatoria princeps RMCB-10]|jgi:hypothetical protein|nr:AAA-like domain-containing protein [Oscillatoria princeps RMCB-10]
MSSPTLRVAPEYIEPIKSALGNIDFSPQKVLAEDVNLPLATVSAFLNGQPVDYLNFVEISQRLALDWRKIAADKAPASVELAEAFPDSPPDEEAFDYVERPPVESRALQALLQPGSLLRIKAPRRTGKTSLMARILHQAKQQGCQTVSLNLLLADAAVLKDLDKFLRWFCAIISRQLRLPARLADYWEEDLGCNYNCKVYFEEYLLNQINSPLVLCLDEVDRLFPHPEIAGDFFPLLRAWHEEAKTRNLWKKLRLVVAHSTEVYIQLNINQSPFNVGESIELPDFTPEQVKDLAHRQGLDWHDSQIEQLMNMVGGHPYLVRRAIYHLKLREMTLEQLLETAATESGIYSEHLRGHWWNLQQHPELAEAMKKLAEAPAGVELEPLPAYQLQSLGLVRWEGNRVRLRCDLYRQYFCGTAKKPVRQEEFKIEIDPAKRESDVAEIDTILRKSEFIEQQKRLKERKMQAQKNA